MFVLNSDITIGNYHFNGVNDVRIRKSLHGVIEEAMIRVPSLAYGQKGKLNNDGTITMAAGSGKSGITRGFFTDGDPVTIKLGYNGQIQTEFVGFVRQRGLNMPLDIECEGYARQLRLNVSINKKYTTTTLKGILGDMLAGTDIKLRCEVDCNIAGVSLIEANGLQILDFLRQASDRTLTFFFINGTTLYCGLPYTTSIAGTDTFGLGQVGYRLGFNLKRDNGLKMKIQSEPVEVIMQGRYATQAAVMISSKDKFAKTKVKSLLNHIPDNNTLQLFADEKRNVLNYTGMEGRLNGFLQPFCQPGWLVKLVDKINPDVNGVYLVESTEVLFGMGGGKRIVELGPKISNG